MPSSSVPSPCSGSGRRNRSSPRSRAADAASGQSSHTPALTRICRSAAGSALYTAAPRTTTIGAPSWLPAPWHLDNHCPTAVFALATLEGDGEAGRLSGDALQHEQRPAVAGEGHREVIAWQPDLRGPPRQPVDRDVVDAEFGERASRCL